MQAVEATYGGVGSEQRVFTREGEAVAARMQDSIDGIKIEERQAAAYMSSSSFWLKRFPCSIAFGKAKTLFSQSQLPLERRLRKLVGP